MNSYDLGFNLILCYFALGEKERMKNGFRKLLSIPSQQIDSFVEQNHVGKDEPIHDHAVFTHDALRDIAHEKYLISTHLKLETKLQSAILC